MDQLGAGKEAAESIQQLLGSAAEMSRLLKDGAPRQISDLFRKVVYRVVVHPEHVQVLLKQKALRTVLMNERQTEQVGREILYLEFTARVGRRGREVRFVVSPSAAGTAPAFQSQALLKAVARAQDWRDKLVSGLRRPAGT
jgi:hypothetical protein